MQCQKERMSYGPTSKMLLYEDPFCKAATILAGRPFVIVVKVVKVNINVMKTRTTFHELIMSLPNATRQGKFYFNTLLDFMENMDNFEARTERVNFGLFQSNSDFT